MTKLAVLQNVLKSMHENKIPLTKINIQKIVYFLREVGLPLTYKFEPYTYGPYSFELKSELSNMTVHDKIKNVDDNTYELDSESMTPISDSLTAQINSQIQKYKKALGDSLSFDSMEIAGTVIYCYRALQNFGSDPSKENVVQEFINWKGAKYSNAEVERNYDEFAGLLN